MNFKTPNAPATAPLPRSETAETKVPNPPAYRLWLVCDRSDGAKPDWIDLSGLWPTKDGNGLVGQVNRAVPIVDSRLTGRLVILPEKDRAASAEVGA